MTEEERNATYRDRDWLYDQYTAQRKSTYQISNELDVGCGTIWQWLKRLGISTRSLSQAVALAWQHGRGGELAAQRHSIRDGVGGKKCIDCGKWKPLCEYSRERGRSDGLRIYCKICANIQGRRNRRKRVEYNRRLLGRYLRLIGGCPISGEMNLDRVEWHAPNGHSDARVSTLMGSSTKKLGAEVRICIPLRADLHRELHCRRVRGENTPTWRDLKL